MDTESWTRSPKSSRDGRGVRKAAEMDTESWTRSPKSCRDGHGVLTRSLRSSRDGHGVLDAESEKLASEGEGYDPLDLSSDCAYDGAMASIVRRLSQDWALCVSLRAIRLDWDSVLSLEADMSPSGRDTSQDPNVHTCTQGMAANGRCQLRNTAGITMYEGNLCSDASGI
ncbi:hypothetical protein CDL15_Pgr017010 [Punica granatum]|uniref:Uncharacterized protein n=1 Tax=Punica granatum TaxID=22663 RepID=A0A218WZW3_PUNGR|nr:hypothetical protein CDL15_Pgr017010 [Punica granatum]